MRSGYGLVPTSSSDHSKANPTSHTALESPLYILSSNHNRKLIVNPTLLLILTLFFFFTLSLTNHMPSNFLDTTGIMVRGRFVRKLKLLPTITNLKKQGLLLQKRFPTPYHDYKENNLSELVLQDDNHFEEEEKLSDKMASCNNQYPSLSDFKELCPPGGNHSIILYTTSLRGIRKTFHDCNTIRFLLRSFKIVYHERDVSLHLEFREELWKILGGKVIPPKLFINGRYIGGADEVVGLHETGWLGKFLEGTPTHSSDSPCTGCANIRFAICSNCSGSCKVFSGNRDNNDECFVRCPDCNENGLVKCPVCC